MRNIVINSRSYDIVSLFKVTFRNQNLFRQHFESLILLLAIFKTGGTLISGYLLFWGSNSFRAALCSFWRRFLVRSFIFLFLIREELVIKELLFDRLDLSTFNCLIILSLERVLEIFLLGKRTALTAIFKRSTFTLRRFSLRILTVQIVLGTNQWL